MWFLVVIAVAVYAADTFTAVNLLAFNTWPGQIKPSIPFNVSKWIFAICILLSWTLCAYEWFRAIKTIRRGSVAKDYLDPLASTLQSIRVGRHGHGWKRFLVFASLTKSKKGADYVALFAYFQFKGAVRIILAEGPRQAINAMTLYAVMQSNLLAKGDNNNEPSFDQFWGNVRVLADTQREHAVILFTMLFTLIIWVFSALSFIVACVLYVGFLWHYIPDHQLSRYCRKKIDKRTIKIAAEAVARAVERREAKQRRLEMKLQGVQGTTIQVPQRRPTLPMLDDKSDVESISTTITRQSSDASLPPYAPIGNYREPSQNAPAVPRKPLPIRSMTPSRQRPITVGQGWTTQMPMHFQSTAGEALSSHRPMPLHAIPE